MIIFRRGAGGEEKKKKDCEMVQKLLLNYHKREEGGGAELTMFKDVFKTAETTEASIPWENGLLTLERFFLYSDV